MKYLRIFNESNEILDIDNVEYSILYEYIKKLEIDDRIIILCDGKEHGATVLYMDKRLITFEFDEKIKNGHNGIDGNKLGKNGHCWKFSYNSNSVIRILKRTLKNI